MNAMTETEADAAAHLLIDARNNRNHVDASALELSKADFDAAYRIQRLIAEKSQSPIAGWKVGAANFKQQEMFGLSEPFFGPVFQDDYFLSPATLAFADYHMIGVETEIMFQISDQYAPTEKTLNEESMAELISGIRVGFEVFSSRLADPFGSGAAALTADCGGNGALVVSDLIQQWSDIDFANVTSILSVNGEKISDGTGAAVLGNPLKSFHWFINKRHAMGLSLNAGEVVAAGSLTPLYIAKQGECLEAAFSGLPCVALDIV